MQQEIDDFDWNDDAEEEVSVREPQSLIVFSRDWTVETIVRQIERNNIDLNPKFQRRNAWNDEKRSKLIESLLIGVPVPEIVMAEDRERKGSFIVIDGKQRLSAVAGFLHPEKFDFWKTPKLKSLKSRSDLNGKSFKDLEVNGQESEDQSKLQNADIRCTIISNYKDVSVLYDIFYRLNVGSVPLSSQELRQVLNRGPFADFIIESTNEKIPLHEVLRLDGPDARLRDAEILLRYIAFSLFGKNYDGNLTPFLDSVMASVNRDWAKIQKEIKALYVQFNDATAALLGVFPKDRVGRKVIDGEWEPRFNRALFEVQAYYFARVKGPITAKNKVEIVNAFKIFCTQSAEFRDSIETSTKTVNRTYARFALFQSMINHVLGAKIDSIPVEKK